jgi:hypothetical protein
MPRENEPTPKSGDTRPEFCDEPDCACRPPPASAAEAEPDPHALDVAHHPDACPRCQYLRGEPLRAVARIEAAMEMLTDARVRLLAVDEFPVPAAPAPEPRTPPCVFCSAPPGSFVHTGTAPGCHAYTTRLLAAPEPRTPPCTGTPTRSDFCDDIACAQHYPSSPEPRTPTEPVCHMEGEIGGVVHVCNRAKDHPPPHVMELFKKDTPHNLLVSPSWPAFLVTYGTEEQGRAGTHGVPVKVLGIHVEPAVAVPSAPSPRPEGGAPEVACAHGVAICMECAAEDYGPGPVAALVAEVEALAEEWKSKARERTATYEPLDTWGNTAREAYAKAERRHADDLLALLSRHGGGR